MYMFSRRQNNTYDIQNSYCNYTKQIFLLSLCVARGKMIEKTTSNSVNKWRESESFRIRQGQDWIIDVFFDISMIYLLFSLILECLQTYNYYYWDDYHQDGETPMIIGNIQLCCIVPREQTLLLVSWTTRMRESLSNQKGSFDNEKNWITGRRRHSERVNIDRRFLPLYLLL